MLLEAFRWLAAICFGDVMVAARSVRAMVPRQVLGENANLAVQSRGGSMQFFVAFFAAALQFPEDIVPPDLVLEGEVFEVGESIDRRLRSDPVDVGFDKAVPFH